MMFWNTTNSFDATKLKATLRLANSRFDVAKNKKEALMKQNMREIATLLAEVPQPKEEKARIRVERLIKDDQRIEGYEILQLECQLLLERVQLLKHSSTCPPDLVTCISDLIYAAPRVGDEIPELLEIKNLMYAKFGKTFAMDADTNKDGTMVSPRIVEKLSLDPPTAYLVQNYMMKIAKLYDVTYEPTIQLTLEEAFEPIAAPIGYSVPVATGTGLGKDVYHYYNDNSNNNTVKPEIETASTATACYSSPTSTASGSLMPPTNPDFHIGGNAAGKGEGSSITVMKAIAYVPEEEELLDDGSGKHLNDHNTISSGMMSSEESHPSSEPSDTVAGGGTITAPTIAQPKTTAPAPLEEEEEEEESYLILNKNNNDDIDDKYRVLTGLAPETTGTVTTTKELVQQTDAPTQEETLSRETYTMPSLDSSSPILDNPSELEEVVAAAAEEESKLELLRNRLHVLAAASPKARGDGGDAVAPTTTPSMLLPVETGTINHEEVTEKAKNVATTMTTKDPVHIDDDDEEEEVDDIVEQEDSREQTILRNDKRVDQEGFFCNASIDHTVDRVKDNQEEPSESPETAPDIDDCEDNSDVLLSTEKENIPVVADTARSSPRMGASEMVIPFGNDAKSPSPPATTTTTNQKDGGDSAEHITGAALAGGAVGFAVAGSLGGLLGAAGAAHLASKKKTEGGKAANMARKCGKKVAKMTNKLVQKIDRD